MRLSGDSLDAYVCTLLIWEALRSVSRLDYCTSTSSQLTPVYLICMLVCARVLPQNPEGEENEDIIYSTEASNWPVIDSYTSGQVIEVDIIIEYYHAVSEMCACYVLTEGKRSASRNRTTMFEPFSLGYRRRPPRRCARFPGFAGGEEIPLNRCVNEWVHGASTSEIAKIFPCVTVVAVVCPMPLF